MRCVQRKVQSTRIAIVTRVTRDEEIGKLSIRYEDDDAAAEESATGADDGAAAGAGVAAAGAA